MEIKHLVKLNQLNTKLCELSYVARGKEHNGYSSRGNPIIVDINVLDNAKIKLVEIPQRIFNKRDFLSEFDHDDLYLLNGGIVDVHNRIKGVEYIGLYHEDKVGLAYLANRLGLPQNGEKIK